MNFKDLRILSLFIFLFYTFVVFRHLAKIKHVKKEQLRFLYDYYLMNQYKLNHNLAQLSWCMYYYIRFSFSNSNFKNGGNNFSNYRFELKESRSNSNYRLELAKNRITVKTFEILQKKIFFHGTQMCLRPFHILKIRISEIICLKRFLESLWGFVNTNQSSPSRTNSY